MYYRLLPLHLQVGQPLASKTGIKYLSKHGLQAISGQLTVLKIGFGGEADNTETTNKHVRTMG